MEKWYDCERIGIKYELKIGGFYRGENEFLLYYIIIIKMGNQP